jgi:hypothetical protein
MSDSSRSRRDFLRGVLGRAAREVSSAAPEAMVEAARNLARGEATPRREPTSAELAHAFVVPDDQADVADALADRGLLLRTGDGRWVARRDLSGASDRAMGTAVASWMDRAGRGTLPQRSRPRDAMLLAEVRRELDLR